MLACVLSDRPCVVGATDRDWIDPCGLVARAVAGGVIVLDTPDVPRESGNDRLGVEVTDCRRLVMRSMMDLRALSLLADGVGRDWLCVLGVSIWVLNLMVQFELDVSGWAGVGVVLVENVLNCRGLARLPKFSRLGAGVLTEGADGVLGAGLLRLGAEREGIVIEGRLTLGAGLERMVPNDPLELIHDLDGAVTGGLLELMDGLDDEMEGERGALMEGLGARDGAGLGLTAARRCVICCMTVLRLDPPCAANITGQKAPSEKPP